MEKERFDFLHKEYIKALQYCNAIYENDAEQFADLETAEENFLIDVFMLAFFPICADHKITETELDRFNTLMEECGMDFRVNADDAAFVLGEFEQHNFEIPKSLILFDLRASVDLIRSSDDKKDNRIAYNLGYLDYILCHYADLMVSMPDEITPTVKETILNCLTACCEYIAKSLSLPFTLSENVMGFIEDSKKSTDF